MAYIETYGILILAVENYLIFLKSTALLSTLSEESFGIIPSDDCSKCVHKSESSITMVKVSSDNNLVAFLTMNKLHIILLSDFYHDEVKPYRVYQFDNYNVYQSFSWLNLKEPSPDNLLGS